MNMMASPRDSNICFDEFREPVTVKLGRPVTGEFVAFRKRDHTSFGRTSGGLELIQDILGEPGIRDSWRFLFTASNLSDILS